MHMFECYAVVIDDCLVTVVEGVEGENDEEVVGDERVINEDISASSASQHDTNAVKQFSFIKPRDLTARPVATATENSTDNRMTEHRQNFCNFNDGERRGSRDDDKNEKSSVDAAGPRQKRRRVAFKMEDDEDSVVNNWTSRIQDKHWNLALSTSPANRRRQKRPMRCAKLRSNTRSSVAMRACSVGADGDAVVNGDTGKICYVFFGQSVLRLSLYPNITFSKILLAGLVNEIIANIYNI